MQDNTLKVWNMHAMKCLDTLSLKEPWNCFTFQKTSSKLIGGSKGSLQIHNISGTSNFVLPNSAELKYSHEISLPGSPSKLLCLSSLPNSLLVGTEDGKLIVVDISNGQITHKEEIASSSIHSLLAIENKVYASSGASIFEYDIRAFGKVVQNYQGKSPITSIALCDDLVIAGQLENEILAFEPLGISF